MNFKNRIKELMKKKKEIKTSSGKIEEIEKIIDLILEEISHLKSKIK